MTSQPKHLNYIGSKHSLLDWLHTTILQTTGYSSFQGKTVADLFGGTGVVSFHFRNQGAKVLSNDIEPCSYIVTKAMTEGVYTSQIKEYLDTFNQALQAGLYKETVGFMTKHYSPYDGCERKFFTVDNAKRMDYIRKQLVEVNMTEEERVFLLASLLVSADAVANCASVYGAYLKEFKKSAEKPLLLQPIHQCSSPSTSKTVTSDVLNREFLDSIEGDIAYLDPPYNERQYSKNYFPLSVLAFSPSQQETQILSGKTGIPALCFTSPFCSKRTVKESFQTLIEHLKTKWLFISYNSESLLDKETMIELLKTQGTITVIEKPYKRFKSHSKEGGEEKKEIKEYLFCLQRV
jgi:adenine-specific DNA-methyltransferase